MIPYRRRVLRYYGLLGYRWPRYLRRRETGCRCFGCQSGLYRQPVWTEEISWRWLGRDFHRHSISHYSVPA